MRSPFTGVIFAVELTHQVNVLLPLLVAAVVAHGFTVLTLRRSILTEKVSRRGYHLSREYAVDPLEILFVRDVMRTDLVVLPAEMPAAQLAHSIHLDHAERGQLLYPVVDRQRHLVGLLPRDDIRKLSEEPSEDRQPRTLAHVSRPVSVVAYPDEPLRVVVHRMAETGKTRLPVVERPNPRNLIGFLSLSDLLKARTRNLLEERRRERVLHLRFWRGNQTPIASG